MSDQALLMFAVGIIALSISATMIVGYVRFQQAFRRTVPLHEPWAVDSLPISS
ncbi:MAG: hypothetical protein ACJATT_004096 [Myxococcota bacterium]|jgi:hypothetical protein